jgi:hypothetical protein
MTMIMGLKLTALNNLKKNECDDKMNLMIMYMSCLTGLKHAIKRLK